MRGGNSANPGTEHRQSGATARTVLYLCSDFPWLGVRDVCFPPLPPKSFPGLATSLEEATDLTRALTTFAVAVPYVAVLTLGARSSTVPTEVCKKGLNRVLSTWQHKPCPVHSPERVARPIEQARREK